VNQPSNRLLIVNFRVTQLFMRVYADHNAQYTQNHYENAMADHVVNSMDCKALPIFFLQRAIFGEVLMAQPKDIDACMGDEKAEHISHLTHGASSQIEGALFFS
jgi:hypothetical protein